jgi:hypothetical protein
MIVKFLFRAYDLFWLFFYLPSLSQFLEQLRSHSSVRLILIERILGYYKNPRDLIDHLGVLI